MVAFFINGCFKNSFFCFSKIGFSFSFFAAWRLCVRISGTRAFTCGTGEGGWDQGAFPPSMKKTREVFRGSLNLNGSP